MQCAELLGGLDACDSEDSTRVDSCGTDECTTVIERLRAVWDDCHAHLGSDDALLHSYELVCGECSPLPVLDTCGMCEVLAVLPLRPAPKRLLYDQRMVKHDLASMTARNCQGFFASSRLRQASAPRCVPH